ncbi:hypothetical protein CVT24_004536 [Panaeolus cyanescens]|uniref:Six-hairpin glycosidase n=1 Tax=Panaeolus cyanescens TaxID=181874 RepID=A0A409YBU5_9AGAR|nr:hypothetical protein CVT24_004536 [Panaeolus cyanescens]
MVNLDVTILPAIGAFTAAIQDFTAFPFYPGFPIRNVTKVASTLPSHSWEYGTATQMLLELYNPEFSVFGARPFPVPSLDKDHVRAMEYAFRTIKLGTGYNALAAGEGSSGDPASLGVGAVLLGKRNATYARAAKETVDGLLNDVPRFSNGAISHRFSVAELWADFMYMAPPFLAYYAADTDDAELLQESVRQSKLYREILQDPSTGVWRHIIGPQSQDVGLWSTGNAWAAAGMCRILATITKAPVARTAPWRNGLINEITGYIKEIVDGAIASPHDDGLLRNYYYGTGSNRAWGEISGSTLIASVVYRMAVLQPGIFAQGSYIRWADGIKETISGNDEDGKAHVTPEGIVRPAVNPLDWWDVNKFERGSPEGNAFTVLLYTAWRDCVLAHRCRNPDAEPQGPGSDAGVAAEAGEASDATRRDVEGRSVPVARSHEIYRRNMNMMRQH